MAEKKTVCILCSLSSKEICEEATRTFEELGMSVHHPFLDQNGSLYRIQRNYIRAIYDADIILVIPKKAAANEQMSDVTSILMSFGESVSYEIATADFLNKPVIIWGNGGAYYERNRETP